MGKFWHITPRLLSLAAIMLITGPALAQTILPPVIVTAPPGGSADGSLDLDRAAAVGSRLGLTLKEQPAAVEIVPGEVIRLRGDMSAQEAVTRATGITAVGTPGDGSSALVSRGFSGHNSITQLYDGTRLYSAAFTQTFPVDTWLLDRIEVLRGPASVLHGVGAIGGALNYVPRQPLRTASLTDVMFAAGSFDTYQLGVNSSGPLSDQLAYQFGVIGTRSDGYVDDGDSQRLSAASSLLFDVTPDFTLRVAFDGTWNEPLRYFGTPLNDGAIDTRLRDQNYNVSDSVMRWQDYWVRLRAEWRIMPELTLQNEVYYLLADRHWRNAENYTFRPGRRLVDRTSYIEVLHDQEQFGNRFEARLDGMVLQRPYRLVAGVDVNHVTFRSTSNSPFSGDSTVDAFRPDPGRFLHIDPTLPRFDTETTQVAFFTEALLRITDNLKLVAGLRLDYIDYTRDNLIDPSLSFDKTLTPLTWRVGGVLDVTKAIALYAQISSGTDPLGSLITLSLFESDFKLTTAQQYEVGVKTQFLEGRGEATLATYYIVKENLLTTDPTNPDVTIQIGQQSSFGFEATVGLTPIPQLTINANLALLNAQFDDLLEADGNTLVSREGKQPPDVPELTANLWVVYSPTAAWRLGTGVRHIGERFADNANTVREPPYTLVDAFVSYTPWQFLNVTLRGRNLTDADYAIAAYGSTQLILGQPRSVEFVANLRF